MTDRRPTPGRFQAFTLLEVLVAVAILAVGMTVLLQVQARSAVLAEQAKALTVATQLARGKLYDCETEMLKRGFSEADFQEEGRFDDEGYDDFFWECHGYKPELPMPDAADFQEAAASAAQGANEGESPLGGLLGGGAQAGAPIDPGMMGAGMGMVAPVLSQVSEIMGDSIRELTVVVRWKQGDIWDELRVTTHLVDPTGIRALAQQIQGMAGQLGALTGGGLPGAGGGGGKGNTGGNSRGNTGNRGGAPANNSIPGMRGAN